MPQFAPPLLDINQAGSQGRGKGRPGSRFSMLKPGYNQRIASLEYILFGGFKDFLFSPLPGEDSHFD